MGQTKVTYRDVRDILTKASGFVGAYDYTLNPYAGCSFGCTYCYAAFFSRSTEEQNSREKQDSWGRWLEVKDNAVECLERNRKRGKLNGTRVYMSSVTDPYQPIERKLNLTRRLLEIMAQRPCPKLVVQTRSPDVVRDCDLFRLITSNGGQVQVNMTVTTDDEDMRRTFEPYCPDNRTRLQVARTLCAEGVDTCITITPLLLIRDVEKFKDDLLDTGIQKFVIQSFQIQRGRFVAGTRDTALCLMAEKLSSDVKTFHRAYLDHYQHVRAILSERLPSLGEGKEGFCPSF